MANLLIPRREIWTQQPQGSIDIDWGNPITRSLKFAFLGGEYVESVSKKQATVTGFTKKPTAAGMGYVQTGTGSVAYAISPLTGGACTLVSKFYFKPSASMYTECVAQILLTGDTSRVGLYANLDQTGSIASGSIALLVRINAANTVRAAMSSVSEGWHTVVAVWGGGSTISLWLDGKPATVTHSNAGTVSSFFAAGQVVRTFGNGAHDNPVVFGAGINRAVSEAEARSLSANPYQIFVPRTTYLFSATTLANTISLGLVSAQFSAQAYQASADSALGAGYAAAGSYAVSPAGVLSTAVGTVPVTSQAAFVSAVQSLQSANVSLNSPDLDYILGALGNAVSLGLASISSTARAITYNTPGGTVHVVPYEFLGDYDIVHFSGSIAVDRAGALIIVLR